MLNCFVQKVLKTNFKGVCKVLLQQSLQQRYLHGTLIKSIARGKENVNMWVSSHNTFLIICFKHKVGK